jgi:hypothetical protein
MKAVLIVVLIFAVGLLILLRNYSEGFDTAQDVQDRFNPLAQRQNPLTNPAAQIGIPEAEGAALSAMMQTALNIPKAVPNASGTLDQEMPLNPLSPRIDNDKSLLGMTAFCKKGGLAKDPFSDPAFNANCGMCLSSGTLITGETFTTPTGVLVYDVDKKQALADKKSYKYIFPRVVPSMRAATCKGASLGDDVEPVLAIEAKDFEEFKKRRVCRDNMTIGNECGLCVVTKKYSWVPKIAGGQAINLWLWGAGLVSVNVGGVDIDSPAELSMTKPVKMSLGKVKEGAVIVIKVKLGAGTDGPWLYGALQSTTPTETIFRINIEKFLQTDGTTGYVPRTALPKYFSDLQIVCAKILPQVGQSSMTLNGIIPFSFVEGDQLAAFDCQGGPYVTEKSTAELLIDDPCLSPPGQRPGGYSTECLQKTVMDAGCSTDGKWYKELPIPQGMDRIAWMNSMKNKTSPNDSAYAMGCLGVDTRTPCDGPNMTKECLIHLYTNASEKTSVGKAYSSTAVDFTGFFSGNTSFCREDGSLNPEKPGGEQELTVLAKNGYSGYKGVEAVKRYLTDVYNKATGNLDINKEDSEGGRKTSWMKCIGKKIADAPLNKVKTNSKGEITGTQRNGGLPETVIPKQNTIIGTIMASKDYILSFDITPHSTVRNWGSIIHFTKGGDCCGTGQRIPAVWFIPGGLGMHVRFGDLAAGGNFGFDNNGYCPLGQKSSFRLECIGKSVTLTINAQTWNVTQPTTRDSGKVTVYSADGFYEPANATITNLAYRGL